MIISVQADEGTHAMREALETTLALMGGRAELTVMFFVVEMLKHEHFVVLVPGVTVVLKNVSKIPTKLSFFLAKWNAAMPLKLAGHAFWDGAGARVGAGVGAGVGTGVGAGVGAEDGAGVGTGAWALTEATNTSATARDRSVGEAMDLLDAIGLASRGSKGYQFSMQPGVCLKLYWPC